MSNSDKALRKYLQHYAEPEAAALTDFPGSYQHAVVIPCYREPLNAFQRMFNFIGQQTNSLLILVSNRPPSDNDTQWHRAMLDNLSSSLLWSSNDKQLCLFAADNGSAILVVDRVLRGEPIATDQGVGLARKIGADIACQLIANTTVQSPWIANTDADALLPADYFTAQKNTGQAAALVYPYQHIFLDDCPRLPTLLYEFSLHYYVEGLRWAGSSYAYHTLGSIIAIHYQHYAQVRGFPKRPGAEDFYILSKLAKTGKITTPEAPIITIQARHSDRVPFGTGPATSRLAQQTTPLAMPVYHPVGFVYLKLFLQLLQKLAETPQDYLPLISVACEQDHNLDAHQLQLCCEQLKLSDALAHCFSQGTDAASRQQHLRTWFDGFKTLKFIHLMRDQSLGMIPYQDWRNYWHPSGLPDNDRMLALADQIQQLACAPDVSGE